MDIINYNATITIVYFTWLLISTPTSHLLTDCIVNIIYIFYTVFTLVIRIINYYFLSLSIIIFLTKFFLKRDWFQEAFNILTRYGVPAEREHLELVDGLRDTWQRLQSRALDTHVKLLEAQPKFEADLASNLEVFRLWTFQFNN